MKFLGPNYSCLQNPWLGATALRSPFSLSSTEFDEPPPPPPEQNSWVRHCLHEGPTIGLRSFRFVYMSYRMNLLYFKRKIIHTKSVAPCCSSLLLAHMKINVGLLSFQWFIQEAKPCCHIPSKVFWKQMWKVYSFWILFVYRHLPKIFYLNNSTPHNMKSLSLV